MKRREFLVQTSLAAAGGVAAGLFGGCASAPGKASAGGTKAAIIVDPADPVASSKPAQWGVERLRSSLTARGFDTSVVTKVEDAPGDAYCIVAAGRNSPMTRDAGVRVSPEAESLAVGGGNLGSRPVLVAAGSDPRGLSYALTDLADAVALSENPQLNFYPGAAVAERPANPVRSVMRLFASDIEDKGWYNDRAFWRDYLSLLAAERFNRFNLAFGLSYDAPNGLRDTYLYFAYPFLLSVPGYDVRAVGLPDAERDHNLEMLRFISDEAAARGLQFQLGLWTHAYQWTNSPNVNYVISGLTPQTQAPYSRDALALVLKECPNITGVTFRIHGESGVPEGSYDLWRTIFDGLVLSGRRVELDMHAKGMDQPTIDAALSTKLPVTISPKYWAEHLGLPYHQAAIRSTEMPRQARGSGAFAQSNGARSFLRYGYGDLLTANRQYGIIHRTWPGTQRVLLWGDPAFAAAYGRSGTFCGSLGHEIFDPLSFRGRKGSGLPGRRDGYAESIPPTPGGDFQKYRYTYRLWGRHLYNPDTKPEVWRRQLREDYGANAEKVEVALGAVSRVLPLSTTAHLPAAANNNYWPEMYVNMSIVDAARVDTRRPDPFGATETPAPRRFGTVNPLDPQLFYRVEDYADDLVRNQASGKYSPVEVAQWMEDFSATAQNTGVFNNPPAPSAAPFFRCAVDGQVQIYLGQFFAQKLRAGTLYALYMRTGDPAPLDAALKTYRAARETWAKLATVTAPVYTADMTYGDAWFQRGNWGDRLDAIDRDIAAMEQAGAQPAPQPVVPGLTAEKIASFIRAAQGRPQRPEFAVMHSVPKALVPGQPLDLAIAGAGAPAPTQATLFYRHANQAENWRSMPMSANGANFVATIPADYTNSPFPMLYYYELADAAGRKAIYPGFNATLTSQPYFSLMQA